MFKPGDYAIDNTSNERVQIISANEAWGFVSYNVYNPITNVVYKLATEARGIVQRILVVFPTGLITQAERDHIVGGMFCPNFRPVMNIAMESSQ